MFSFFTDFSNSVDTGLRPGGLDIGGLLIPLAGMAALLYATYKLARILRDSDDDDDRIIKIKVKWALLPQRERGTI